MTLKKLSELPTGKNGRIADILKYRNENECMGVYPDLKIEVLTNNTEKGPCILRTGNSRKEIVMTREMGEHIVVDTD